MNRLEAFEYHSDTRVLFGQGCIAQLGDAVRRLSSGPVLLVTDPGIVAAGLAARALASLDSAGLQVEIFDGVEENPTTLHVQAGVQFVSRTGVEFGSIVGLGGGSAMDCAKGINFLLTNGGRMEDYWGDGKATTAMLPSIGVPTTAGTGSEAQRFALIAQDQGEHQKMACGDRKVRFRTVLLDPDLLSTAPAAVVAAAAVDAVAHAVESFVTTRANPVSRLFAGEALRLLHGSFESWVGNHQSSDTGGAVLLGAHWAGAAIEHSMLGAAHACANPLTGRYGITHGVAVGVMLPHVIRYNGTVVNGDYANLVKVAGIAVEVEESAAADVLADRVGALYRSARMPSRLSELPGVKEEELESLAQRAASQMTAGFNPRAVGRDECHQLYRAAF
ncbi:MAG: iron-containing alcohol dehydrogenase [Candidatus Latescibacterota bacterium]